MGVFRPAARWAGWTLFLVAAAWLLATTLSSLRRRGHRGGGFSPSLRLTAAGSVLALGLTACNAGPGGPGVSTDPVLSGDTLKGPPPGTYFYHRNHINSSSVVTDYLGAEVSRYVYLPFGELSQANSTGLDTATRKYTGQEHDEETGLYYYNARYYDPAIGRFLSPDTVVPSVSDGQAFNRYSYVRNNPIIYTDPSGHSWKAFRIIATAVLVAAAVVLAVCLLDCPDWRARAARDGDHRPRRRVCRLSGLRRWDWDAIEGMLVGALVGGAAGAVSGGIVGLQLPGFWGAVATGAMTGAVSGAASAVATGYQGGVGGWKRDFWRSVELGALTGAATGALIGRVPGRLRGGAVPEVRQRHPCHLVGANLRAPAPAWSSPAPARCRPHSPHPPRFLGL